MPVPAPPRKRTQRTFGSPALRSRLLSGGPGSLHLPGPGVGPARGAPAPRADPGVLRGAQTGLVPGPSSGRQKHAGTRQQPGGTARPRAQRLSVRPAAGAPDPVFILLTITKAIYLFHLERDLAPVTSLEGSLAFLPPATPGMCVPCLPSPGCLWCVPTWAPVSLFGSLDLRFPGGSALSSERSEYLGGHGSTAVAAPVSPCCD